MGSEVGTLNAACYEILLVAKTLNFWAEKFSVAFRNAIRRLALQKILQAIQG